MLTVKDAVLLGVSVAGAEYTVLPDKEYRRYTIVMICVRLVLLNLTSTASGLPAAPEGAASMVKVMLGVRCAGGEVLPGTLVGSIFGGGVVGTRDLEGLGDEVGDGEAASLRFWKPYD
jgi:hypothetical protein